MTPPSYYNGIREEAKQRWNQLENDPKLAAPWHQLFSQVQNPRNVLSELLQNADDAGATEVTVRVENQEFVFEHNGHDFTEEHFASLCQFGYSNKRLLHTIGFRGIGFKSTFSLGDRVDLFTPSLSVCFHRERFTEPHWLHEYYETRGRTRIRVAIADLHKQQEFENSLLDWLESPVSLLFFSNIRNMQINDSAIHWNVLGPGPIPKSEWVARIENKEEPRLLVRSETAAFPDESMNEIRQERMLTTEEDSELPPCSIEIVLGMEGLLFVVLPTGVKTGLPFACNAPFIQDPARLKIKDPETSPTNRWLLKRAGRLAATAFLHWLRQSKLPDSERAQAYALFPDVDQEDNSIEGVCGTNAEEAFDEMIDAQPVLLTECSRLVPKKESIIIPRPILDVWEPDQASALLDEYNRPALCRYIAPVDRERLASRGFVDTFSKQDFVEVLQSSQIPRPKTWRQLFNLWTYISPEVTDYHYTDTDHYYHSPITGAKIVPVQGKDELFDASDVVRLGEDKLLQSDDDWEFLACHLIVLNKNWPRFLAKQRRTATEQQDRSMQKKVEDAYDVLAKCELDASSDVNKVINRVCTSYFSQDDISLKQGIQLAQIGAKLGANVGEAFCFYTRDGKLSSSQNGILFDLDGQVEELLPEQLRGTHLLHPDYSAVFDSCSKDEWLNWVYSGISGLQIFITFVQKRVSFYNRHQIEQDARKRGLTDSLIYPYVTSQFIVEDWDFDQAYWNHWEELAAEDQFLWVKVVDRVLAQEDKHWNHAKTARIHQIATTLREKRITSEPLVSTWILRMRELPCLLDDRGFPRIPRELFRRTSETESLIGIESFVHRSKESEKTSPLLDLLGVQSMPTGPDRLIDRIRGLTQADIPPEHEVERLYGRLDTMMNTCSTENIQKIIGVFQSEKLILTQDDAWVSTSGVYLNTDEENVPGAAVIRMGVRDFAIWRKIGIAERPSAEHAIQWLKGLPSGELLAQDDGRRVRELLKRHPLRVWEECGHWTNLDGEWVPTDSLSYGLTMQFLVPWRHLFSWVKQKTADLQRLPNEVTDNNPFAQLMPLATHTEERFQESLISTVDSVEKKWLSTLGSELKRSLFESDEETDRVRTLAISLEQTRWCETAPLEVTPYIDGKPAGTARRVDVAWCGQVLYLEPMSHGKQARRVPEEIGKAFGRPDIQAALFYCFERSPQNVCEYLRENFMLLENLSTMQESAPDLEKPSDKPKSSSSSGLQDTLEKTLDHQKLEDDLEPGTLKEDDFQETEDSPPNSEEAETPKPSRRVPQKSPKLALIDRFASARRFKKENDRRFVHENGSWIGRTNGMNIPIPWEHRTASGNLIRYYLPKDHCLERESLQLNAEIWNLIEQNPKTYALILIDIDDRPVEVTGTRLRYLLNEGKITLYPATYRLVYDHDQNP